MTSCPEEKQECLRHLGVTVTNLRDNLRQDPHLWVPERQGFRPSQYPRSSRPQDDLLCQCSKHTLVKSMFNNFHYEIISIKHHVTYETSQTKLVSTHTMTSGISCAYFYVKNAVKFNLNYLPHYFRG